MTQSIVLIGIAAIGSIALIVLAVLAVRVAVMPPKGVHPTTAQRIELYAASVALLTVLGQTWIVHPGIASGPMATRTQASSASR
jgi:hypothetical protein